jgi:hypothetical protein
MDGWLHFITEYYIALQYRRPRISFDYTTSRFKMQAYSSTPESIKIWMNTEERWREREKILSSGTKDVERTRRRKIYILRLYAVKRIHISVCRQQHAFKYLTITSSIASISSLFIVYNFTSLITYFLSFLC